MRSVLGMRIHHLGSPTSLGHTTKTNVPLPKQCPAEKASFLPHVVTRNISHKFSRNQWATQSLTRCRAERFPFKEEDYHKCILQVASQGGSGSQPGPPMGHLVFMLEADIPRNPDGSYGRMDTSVYRTGKALLMQIGGDTYHMILSFLEGRRDGRPYALDLLWSVLQRGQEVSKKDWKLLHVAVVALKDTTYIARLFFGDVESGTIVWDCDSRPSDACWLALKTKCPIFMHKDVWNSCAQSLLDMIRSTDVPKSSQAAIEVSPHSIKPSDPEPVKRLKREMEVAISEEDYTTAARIRDHPYMKLFMEISALEKENMSEKAEEKRAELDRLIEGISQEPKRDKS